MKFNNHKNKLIRPYIAYFDFECSLCETGDEEKIAKHEPNSVCYYLVNTKDPSKNKLFTFLGNDCVENFIVSLNNTYNECTKQIEAKEKT